MNRIVTLAGLMTLAAASFAQAQDVKAHFLREIDIPQPIPIPIEGGGAPEGFVLSTTSVDVTEIGLTCVTPADPDGDLIAVEFRYSTSPITIGNYSAAALIKDHYHETYTIGDAGTQVNAVACELAENTTYYFAARYIDAYNLFSQAITTQTTATTPVVIPTPSPLPVGGNGDDGGNGGGNGGGGCGGSASGMVQPLLALGLLVTTLHLRK